MRSICLSLLCACEALVSLARKRSTNSMQLRDFALLVFVGGEQLLLAGLALDEVFVVVAAIADELALADFHDAADELVQKLAVVRDDQDRAGITLQIFLEPEQRLEVEMVRRFVEQQQVRLLRRAAARGARASPSRRSSRAPAGRNPFRESRGRRGSAWPWPRAGSRPVR